MPSHVTKNHVNQTVKVACGGVRRPATGGMPSTRARVWVTSLTLGRGGDDCERGAVAVADQTSDAVTAPGGDGEGRARGELPHDPNSIRLDTYWAEFDSQYEKSRYPTDYLWGPGSREEALVWLEHHDPRGGQRRLRGPAVPLPDWVLSRF